MWRRCFHLAWLTVALPGWALAAGCAPAPFAQAPLSPGTTTWTAFEHRGETRTFALHLPGVGPSGVGPTGVGPTKAGTAVPLVVVLHGAGSSGRGMESATGWSKVADREGFAVVYPDGLGGLLGLGRAWNHGDCCGYSTLFGIDDVAMVDALILTLSTRVEIDPRRRYLVGYSNGGTLAHGLASRSSDLFAAAAIYAASAPATGSLEAPVMVDAPPNPGLSVMLVMSEQDPRIPYYGSEGRIVSPSQRQLAQFYAGAAGCRRHPYVERVFDGAIDRRRFSGCDEGLDVEQLTLWGWDHTWPSRDAIRSCRAPGEQLYGFDAASEMWTFFSDKRR